MYERSDEQQGYVNGFKPKSTQTRIKKSDLVIPQVRKGEFYPEALEKGLCSDRALMVSIATLNLS
ncbi:MAG: transposase [Anaerolineaceae bacterium]|nr:transposase [Anaerolineaceae bacterium]